MQVVCQLKELLQNHNCYHHGVIHEIANAARIDRRQVRAMLDNDLKHIPRNSLSAVCRVLIEDFGIDRDEVARHMFGFAAEDIWSMLAHTHVDYCLGLRTVNETAEPRWTNAYDTMLQGAFLEELFGVGQKRRRGLRQHLVRASNPAWSQERLAEQTLALYATMRKRKGSRTIASLGSCKSNPISECLIASAFSAKPFVVPPLPNRPRQRPVPFFLRYRDVDPRVNSCHAGERLAENWLDQGPGIYYETESGEWKCCPTDARNDAAVVLYVHRPTERSVEMVLAGFSGVATGCVARDLNRLSKDLWPPSLSRNDLKVGAFIVRYEICKPPSAHVDFRPLLPRTRPAEVIPIAANVLCRRILGEEESPPAQNRRASRGRVLNPR